MFGTQVQTYLYPEYLNPDYFIGNKLFGIEAFGIKPGNQVGSLALVLCIYLG